MSGENYHTLQEFIKETYRWEVDEIYRQIRRERMMAEELTRLVMEIKQVLSAEQQDKIEKEMDKLKSEVVFMALKSRKE